MSKSGQGEHSQDIFKKQDSRPVVESRPVEGAL